MMLGFRGTRRPGFPRCAWLILRMRFKVLPLVTCSGGLIQDMPFATGHLWVLALYPPLLQRWLLCLWAIFTSMAHSGSRPGVIPAVCITCGAGLISVLCSLGLCSEPKTVSSDAAWGTWLRSSSDTREQVGAAGLLVGMLRDAQLEPCSQRKWCCAVSWLINPNSSFLGVGVVLM